MKNIYNIYCTFDITVHTTLQVQIRLNTASQGVSFALYTLGLISL
jgi:hypothetical protein